MARRGAWCGVLLLVAGSVWQARAAPRVSEVRGRGALQWAEDDSNSLDDTAPRFRPTPAPVVPPSRLAPGPEVWDPPLLQGPTGSRGRPPPDPSGQREILVEPNSPRLFPRFRLPPKSIASPFRPAPRPDLWRLPPEQESRRFRGRPPPDPSSLRPTPVEPKGPLRTPWAPPGSERRDRVHGVVKKPGAVATAPPESEERAASAESPAPVRTTAPAPEAAAAATTGRSIPGRAPDETDCGTSAAGSAETDAPTPCGAGSESVGGGKPPRGIGFSIIITPPYNPECPDGHKLDIEGKCREVWTRTGREK